MKKILLFVLLFTSLICAQSSQIKQITNLDNDCRNLNSAPFFNQTYFVFEAHSGNSSSIYLGAYYPGVDSFAVISQVTNDNFMNINPKLIYNYDTLFIIYQTNKNGNWDIAYQIYSNNTLSPEFYAADSSADEVNPVVSNNRDGLGFFQTNNFISYERGNSIYIKDVHATPSVETEVFHGDDSTKYGQASLEYNINDYSGTYMSARKEVNGKPYLVFKKLGTNGWENENVILIQGNWHNQRIGNIGFQTYITYTNDIDGKSNIYLQQFSETPDTVEVFQNPQYDYDNFQTQVPVMLTKTRDIFLWGPHTYTASRNDSLFVRIAKNLFTNSSDSLVNTKVLNTSLYLEVFGINSLRYQIYYTIWEDSINGKVQIFGNKDLVPMGNVKNEKLPSDFILYQNYPNPFNPVTSINFKTLHRDRVTLNVYDIMGRKICALVDEEKPAGEYNINFDSRKFNLSSGIYFYRLNIGGSSSVKKMVLMK